ncbi:SDR family oxidoreductase [Aureimonas jatrophae]|uniref:NAD(P)-dependent dehydrogenase, short-chain alcohol dehydrogenase family n=1 Tax=Aureimonas jatrophae TaxID=1166073 RepID=A0A1H0FKE2_9HYPH|nr:SDR family oxidoreductase [Aureimonas jatrophae]MBB3949983.1 NAD(P)-dependent dehydrogenase (short-subunit alcohol dehydrogenase family) [Aureimonas jatrophae]SDN94919.1 NAD(P)-dependent dehydrogenase, short-chain alcohol dehydrogenase family [Aureimonas jatrophae]
MSFEGRTAIVTGAGKGIGRRTAELLAERGARVVALSRSAEDLAALEQAVGARGIAVDLADAAATRAAAGEALPADLLVNCAGINILEPFLEMNDESFDRVQAVNVRAAAIVSQVFARDLVRRGQPGAIVNVSSISSFLGFRDHAAYCASKGAMDGLTRVMANELGPHGIRVNSVAPGITLTDLARVAWEAPEKGGPMLARTPVGRFAETADVAEVILFLLSDAAAMIAGTTLPIDGGFLAV